MSNYTKEQHKNSMMRVTRDMIMQEIDDERERQIEKCGWTPEHDDNHDNNELAKLAACYALGQLTVDYAQTDDEVNMYVEIVITPFPYDSVTKKELDKVPRRRQLIIAGALIIAELERMERAKNKKRMKQISHREFEEEFLGGDTREKK